MLIPALAVCNKDGVWNQTENGKIQVLPCEGEYVGDSIRMCSSTGVWGEVDTQYCLPMYPAKGFGYIDFTYVITGSKWRIIANYPNGIADAIGYSYKIDTDSINVFRVAEHATEVCDVSSS